MSLFLTLSIAFGIVFAIAVVLGYLYEKELVEVERVVFKYIRLRIKARKAGMSVEEYVKSLKAKKASQTRVNSNIISFEDYVA
ncbi:MAG: hypothetical protein E7555_04415 [Ruminococcaceae bacterium]|nr:hypothetical protein [Oscillospiraceae bacterium]